MNDDPEAWLVMEYHKVMKERSIAQKWDRTWWTEGSDGAQQITDSCCDSGIRFANDTSGVFVLDGIFGAQRSNGNRRTPANIFLVFWDSMGRKDNTWSNVYIINAQFELYIEYRLLENTSETLCPFLYYYPWPRNCAYSILVILFSLLFFGSEKNNWKLVYVTSVLHHFDILKCRWIGIYQEEKLSYSRKKKTKQMGPKTPPEIHQHQGIIFPEAHNQKTPSKLTL